jgi:hypothetical protein
MNEVFSNEQPRESESLRRDSVVVCGISRLRFQVDERDMFLLRSILLVVTPQEAAFLFHRQF